MEQRNKMLQSLNMSRRESRREVSGLHFPATCWPGFSHCALPSLSTKSFLPFLSIGCVQVSLHSPGCLFRSLKLTWSSHSTFSVDIGWGYYHCSVQVSWLVKFLSVGLGWVGFGTRCGLGAADMCTDISSGFSCVMSSVKAIHPLVWHPYTLHALFMLILSRSKWWQIPNATGSPWQATRLPTSPKSHRRSRNRPQTNSLLSPPPIRSVSSPPIHLSLIHVLVHVLFYFSSCMTVQAVSVAVNKSCHFPASISSNIAPVFDQLSPRGRGDV